MADAVRTKKVRNGHRIYIKRIVHNVGEFSSREAVLDETAVNKLKAHKKTLQDKLKVLSELNEGILESIEGDEELEKEICESGEFESLMQETILKIESLLGKNMDSPKEQRSEVMSQASANVHCLQLLKTIIRFVVISCVKLLIKFDLNIVERTF